VRKQFEFYLNFKEESKIMTTDPLHVENWFREIVSDLPDDGLTKKAETCSSLEMKIDNQRSVFR
jgi:hypothetical protein